MKLLKRCTCKIFGHDIDEYARHYMGIDICNRCGECHHNNRYESLSETLPSLFRKLRWDFKATIRYKISRSRRVQRLKDFWNIKILGKSEDYDLPF